MHTWTATPFSAPKGAQTIRLLPKQYDFIFSKSRNILYSGAFRAGKSRALCYALAMRASMPGAVEGLCRKIAADLKRTTMKTLLEKDSYVDANGRIADLPPVLMPGTYVHKKNDMRIDMNGGGSILYFGMDQSSRIGSMGLSGCTVDEAVELSEDDMTWIRGRLSVPVDGIVQGQLRLGCNPASPSHFIAHDWGIAPGVAPKPDHKAFMTATADNHYLSKEYIKSLEAFEGIAYKRYVLGKWIASDRLVYDAWERTVYAKEFTAPADGWRRVIIGVDAGYTNPAVMLAIGSDGDGRLCAFEEFYKAGVLETDFISTAREWNKRLGPEMFVVDPSAAGLIASMRAAGLKVQAANNDRIRGVQTVRNRLKIPGDGKPRLRVHPRCVNTIREFETWETIEKPDKEAFSKEFDHAMDALRYAVMVYDGSVSLRYPDPRPYEPPIR